jgi:hypothetical protein
MAEFAVLKDSDAPRPARQTGRLAVRMLEYEQFIDQVPAGKAGRLQPARGESARGLALRISRAANRKGKSIHTWVVDGVVYFSPA